MDQRKALQDMTLEELWQLFPIELSAHRSEWSAWAAEEVAVLARLLADLSPHINHIGSTAVPGLVAKPIVDILVELPEEALDEAVRARMEADGYICMSRSDRRMSFNKGYTPAGYASRVFHIHLRAIGDNDEIYFRDYLRSHPDVALEYGRLKESLLPRFRNDRDGYTAAKTDFISRITRLARPETH